MCIRDSTIERVVASVSRNAGDEPVSIIKEAINKANELLVAESREDEAKRGMGTTLVIGTIKMCIRDRFYTPVCGASMSIFR